MGVKRSDSSATHYLNVDLDIYSTRDLQPLVKAFGSKVIVLCVGRERGKYGAHLEMSRRTPTADSTVRAFCRLIERLPEAERCCGIMRPFAVSALGFEPGSSRTLTILQSRLGRSKPYPR
jgi:hypothetical protein